MARRGSKKRREARKRQGKPELTPKAATSREMSPTDSTMANGILPHSGDGPDDAHPGDDPSWAEGSQLY